MARNNKLIKTSSIDVVGHRFGAAHCIAYVPNTKSTFECVCECGNHFTATRSQLVYGKAYCCPQCKEKNTLRTKVYHDHIVQKYGSITDYTTKDTCVYCGSTLVFNPTLKLCRNCHERLKRRGTLEYAREQRDKNALSPTAQKVAESRARRLARKELALTQLDVMPNNPIASQMADMLVNQRMTYQQIANHFGCSRQYVHYLLHYRETRIKQNMRQYKRKHRNDNKTEN